MAVVVPEPAPDAFIRQFPEYPVPILQLLFNRKLTQPEAIEAFLNPQYHALHDPFLFRDMHTACERIYDAIDRTELIVIHGDYDADGVSGSAILKTALDALGAHTLVFLPHRDKDGYGLNTKTVKYLTDQGARLIITCDCGISNREEIDEAKKLGMDTIITDHHQIPDVVPEAFAIIHPKIASETYPFKQLAGGGVAFKLMQGLLRARRCQLADNQKEALEKWLLDLVALSSVADLVDLTEENRVLVTYGLLVLSKNKRLGFQKLFQVAGIDPKKITTETIAFYIAPRINAAGRMDHANTAFMLLTEHNEAEALRLAVILEQQNKDRQKLTESMYQQALGMMGKQNDKLLIFFNKEWTAGLTGLLAGRLCREFGKPVFVMGYDGVRGVGSGRSPDGVNILDCLIRTRDLLVTYGGHPQACGFRFNLENHDAVVRRLIEHFQNTLPSSAVHRTAECMIGFQDISWKLVESLRRFEPFGQANPEPLFYTQDAMLRDVHRVGKKQNHLKMRLVQGDRTLPAIGFGMESDCLVGNRVDIAYTIRVNEWNGAREIQLQIEHLARHEARL